MREIQKLQIPTYDGMSNVLFWDVLMKLSHSAVKRSYDKEALMIT